MSDPKSTVLIVDDNEVNLHILNHLLTREGYTVKQAKNGETCLEILSKLTPELILLDIIMPGESGLDILKKIKSDSKSAKAPVIMFSILEDPEMKRRALELGALMYMSKPFDMSQVAAQVRTLLSNKPSSEEDQ